MAYVIDDKIGKISNKTWLRVVITRSRTDQPVTDDAAQSPRKLSDLSETALGRFRLHPVRVIQIENVGLRMRRQIKGRAIISFRRD